MPSNGKKQASKKLSRRGMCRESEIKRMQREYDKESRMDDIAARNLVKQCTSS